MLPTPQSSGYLRCMVNAENSINLYNDTNHLGAEVLITDLSAQLTGTDGILADYVTTQNWTRQRLPLALIGSYHTSRAAVLDAVIANYKPVIEFPIEAFASSELLSNSFLDSGRRIIDYSQSSVLQRAVAMTLNWCLDNNVRLLFSDNWSHPSQLAGYIPWSYTVAYMQALVTALAPHNIPVIANIAGWYTASATEAQQAGCLAGISLEDIFGSDVLTSADVATGILSRIASVSKSTIVVAIPATTAECTFYAYVAMLFDHVWVACPYTESIAPTVATNWPNFPTYFGRPLGAYTTSGNLALRRFANGNLVVDLTGQKYSFK